MAQHKAPTQVTVVAHQEKSGFAQFVDQYWKHGAAIAVVGAAGILGSEFLSSQERASVEESWGAINVALEAGSSEELASAAAEAKGTPAEAWALVLLVSHLVNDREYDEAKAALAQLRTTDQSALTKATFPFSDGIERTVVDQLVARIDAQSAWEADKSALFENPALPEGSPKVRVETTAGSFEIGFYQELAPKHVENFLKLVGEDFYNGTKFHRVLSNFMIEGGDPNTKEGEASTWGQGGPGYTIEDETSGLSHFRGVLTALKTSGQTESSGSQFAITTGPAHYYNTQRTAFGVITDGMDVIDVIDVGNDDIEDPATGRPTEPIEILSIELL